MNKILIKFAQLHNPLFLGGRNHQEKLDPKNVQGLKLIYDRAEKELLVEYNGFVAIIPSSNVASMTVDNPIDIGVKVAGAAKQAPPAPVTHVNHPQIAGIGNAQIETPMSGVQNTKAGNTDYINFKR